MEDNGLFEEVKAEFDREIEVKTRLDAKSSNMITASGTVATLVGGFAALVLSSTSSTNQYFYPILILFLVSVSFSIASLCVGIKSYMRKEYEFPIRTKDFRNNGIPTDRLREIQNYSEKKFKNYMTQVYLKCLEKNRPINRLKTELINYAQWFLIIALVVLPVLLIIIGFSNYYFTEPPSSTTLSNP